MLVLNKAAIGRYLMGRAPSCYLYTAAPYVKCSVSQSIHLFFSAAEQRYTRDYWIIDTGLHFHSSMRISTLVSVPLTLKFDGGHRWAQADACKYRGSVVGKES